MLFCDACEVKKMLPLDRIVTADPCLGSFEQCPVYRELTARNGARPAGTSPESPAHTSMRSEVPR